MPLARLFDRRTCLATASVALVAALCLASGATAAAPDFDHDGFPPRADCNNGDPAVHPGAIDKPDLRFEDTNCDGMDGDAAKAVFVSSLVPSGGGAGTRSLPFGSLQQGIDAAKAAHKDVYLTAGNFPGVALTGGEGVSLYGGYSAAWQRSLASNPTSLAGARQAIVLDGAKHVVLKLLRLTASPGDPDVSAYAVRAINGSTVALDAVAAQARAGGGGVAGAAGVSQDVAASGASGGAASCTSGGTGGAGATSPFSATNGGVG